MPDEATTAPAPVPANGDLSSEEQSSPDVSLERTEGFVARWEDLPPVQTQELRSRVWADEAAPEHRAYPPPEPPAQAPAERPAALEPPGPVEDPGAGAGEGQAVDARDAWVSRLEDRIVAAVGDRVDDVTAAGSRAMAESLGRALTRLVASVQQGVHSVVREDISRLMDRLDRDRAELGDRVAKIESALREWPSAASASGLATRRDLDEAVSNLGKRTDEIRRGLGTALADLPARMAETATKDELDQALARVLPSLDGMERRLDQLGQQAATTEQVEALLGAVGRVEAALDQGVTRLAERLGEMRSLLGTRASEIAPDVIDEVRMLVGKVDGRLASSAPALDDARRRLDDLAGNMATTQETQALREAVARLEASIGDRVAQMAERLEETRSSLPGRVSDILSESSARMEELEAALLQRIPDRERIESALLELGARLRQLEERVREAVQRSEPSEIRQAGVPPGSLGF